MALGLLALSLSACSSGQGTAGPGADGGAHILAALRPVLSAMPRGSQVLEHSANDSEWYAKCPDNPGGRSGWSPVIAMVGFRSPLRASAAVSDIASFMKRRGWQRTKDEGPVWGGDWQVAPMAEWARPIARAHDVIAIVFRYPAGFRRVSGTWQLEAMAAPPGFALPGC